MHRCLACLAIALLAACSAGAPRTSPSDTQAPARDAEAQASPAGAASAEAPAGENTNASCDLATVVLPGDQTAVAANADQALARIPSSSRAPDYLGDDLKEASLGGTVLAHALLQRARSPQPVGDISGAWQVRSVQVSGTSVFDYPFFRAEIGRNACGFAFRKTTGSQRRTGQLYPMSGDPAALAFLGTATVNENRTAAYGPGNAPRGVATGAEGDTPVNSAGRLLRIGKGELLMILDLDEDGFELYHLKQ